MKPELPFLAGHAKDAEGLVKQFPVSLLVLTFHEKGTERPVPNKALRGLCVLREKLVFREPNEPFATSSCGAAR